MEWYRPDNDRQVAVNVRTRADFLDSLRGRFVAGQGFSVATLNLDHVVKLRKPGAFRSAYEHHSHVTADGNPIVWLQRLAGQPVELIPGSEVIEPLIKMAADMDVPVAFLGSTQDTLDTTARRLQAQYPSLRIVARLAPPMGFDPEGAAADGMIEELRQSGARLVFLALGAPKQEVFGARAQTVLPEAGFLSIGAGLDFIAGQQVRAPKIFRRLALEWLWRLLGNPTRLARRYGACFLILPGLTWTALSWRLSRKG